MCDEGSSLGFPESSKYLCGSTSSIDTSTPKCIWFQYFLRLREFGKMTPERYPENVGDFEGPENGVQLFRISDFVS